MEVKCHLNLGEFRLYKYEKPFEGITKKKQLRKAIIWYILQNGKAVSIEELVKELSKTYKFPGRLQPSRQLITAILTQNKEFIIDGKIKNKYGHYVNLYIVSNK